MKLYKSFMIISTVWCLLPCPVKLQTSQAAKQNGTKADYDLCGKSSKRADGALIPEFYPSPGVWPWMALIGYSSPRNPNTDFKCEAILISRQWVLTAAHCVQNTGSFRPDFIRLGVVKFDNTLNHSTEQNDFSIDTIISHPEFSQAGKSSDLALIHLKVPVNYTENIRPLCLLNEAKFKGLSEYYKKKRIDIVAYNIQVNDQSNDSLELRRWTTKIVNQTECAQQYNTSKYKNVSIDTKLICVKSTSDDVCETTLGGALLFRNVTERRFYLGGIKSFGSTFCFLDGPPNVFTTVTHFIDWIIQVTGEKFFQ